MRRPRPAAVVLALSLAALGTAGVVAGASLVGASSEPGIEGSVGSRPTGAAPASAAPSPPLPSPSATAPGETRVGDGFRELPQPTRQDVVAPVRLDIPAIGVRSAVVPTGVDPDGTTEVPEDVDVLGWYRFGPGPREEGSTVVVGHRDGRGQGRGALYALGSVGVGDRITVTLEDGSRAGYRVVAREVLEKQAVPLREIFARSGERRLTVISCGGVYDSSRGGYQSNVVVTAVPI